MHATEQILERGERKYERAGIVALTNYCPTPPSCSIQTSPFFPSLYYGEQGSVKLPLPKVYKQDDAATRSQCLE